jgi:hypothetical protein
MEDNRQQAETWNRLLGCAFHAVADLLTSYETSLEIVQNCSLPLSISASVDYGQLLLNCSAPAE